MSLIQKLFDGPIDIVGDIHGEYEALIQLLDKLGYDLDGNHLEGRKLVFVGDFCDRGPDSPAVIKLVKKLIDNGNAQAVLGNHEVNILQKKPKDGTGWYFEERKHKDKNYIPFKQIDDIEKEEVYNFLANLPIALEREDLRVVHAAWISSEIKNIRNLPQGSVPEMYKKFENDIDQYIDSSGILKHYHEEQEKWKEEQEDSTASLPFLEYTAQYNVIHQMKNPLRVLTSGVERRCEVPFFASGKWRFIERCAWWNDYQEEVPVIVGHFWRRLVISEEMLNENEEYIFSNIEPESWHGAKNNVFCVDFSVGGRFAERKKGLPLGTHTALGALRLPENEVMLDSGICFKTKNYFKKIKYQK